MKATRKELLTAAFEDGKSAARNPDRGFSSRLKWKGKAREFFEAGYHAELPKAEAEFAKRLTDDQLPEMLGILAKKCFTGEDLEFVQATLDRHLKS